MIGFFIHSYHTKDRATHRQAKLLVNASFLTSIFSLTYLLISVLIHFEYGVTFMIFNVVVFLLLPFCLKFKIPVTWVGNVYVFAGTLAITALTYYSGGTSSPILPWLVATPTIALLIVNRTSAYFWTVISAGAMVYFGYLSIQGVELPITYDLSWEAIFGVICFTGLLLIVFVINLIFEGNRTIAVNQLTLKNGLLKEANDDILEKNEELLQQKEEISAQTDILQEINDEKDYIIDILAHDLKGPLNSIGGLITLMRTEELSDDQSHYVNLMHDSTEKVKVLINKVLEMGALDQHKIDLNMSSNDIGLSMSKVINEYKEMAQNKNISIVSELLTETNGEFDETFAHQVFDNLLSNAIKFSPGGSTVRVIQSLAGDMIQTVITDEGPGISTDEMDQLFGKFTKLSARPTAGESSTGLGLSLVKRYMQLMGGRVWCESTLDSGASFFVQFKKI